MKIFTENLENTVKGWNWPCFANFHMLNHMSPHGTVGPLHGPVCPPYGPVCPPHGPACPPHGPVGPPHGPVCH